MLDVAICPDSPRIGMVIRRTEKLSSEVENQLGYDKGMEMSHNQTERHMAWVGKRQLTEKGRHNAEYGAEGSGQGCTRLWAVDGGKVELTRIFT